MYAQLRICIERKEEKRGISITEPSANSATTNGKNERCNGERCLNEEQILLNTYRKSYKPMLLRKSTVLLRLYIRTDLQCDLRVSRCKVQDIVYACVRRMYAVEI